MVISSAMLRPKEPVSFLSARLPPTLTTVPDDRSPKASEFMIAKMPPVTEVRP